MIALYLVYCIFLIIYCGFFLLITMASSHQIVETEYVYLIILVLSSCSFIATIFLLLKKLFIQRPFKSNIFIWLLVINILFFIYYSYGFLYENDEVDYVSYSPLLGLVLSILVLLSVRRNNKAAH